MNRRALAALVLVAMTVLAGCATGGVDRSRLGEDADYDYSRNATVTFDVHDGNYHAVVDVTEANQTEFELFWRADIGGEQPLTVAALKFRYPNGTVVGAEQFTVEGSGGRTRVVAPAANGTMAFKASTGYKRLSVPVFAEGSHRVILPGGMHVAAPLFGSVSPGGYERYVADGRVHLHWSETPGGDVTVDYYLERDFYLVTGLAVGLLLLGAVGVLYFRHRIRELRRTRAEAGLDLEE